MPERIVAGEVFTTDGTKIGIAGGTNRIPDFDARAGEHLWCTVAAWRVNPVNAQAGERIELDHENLLYIGGLGCYYCEQMWDPRLLKRRCPGGPR
jgi:hypothetical protein